MLLSLVETDWKEALHKIKCSLFFTAEIDFGEQPKELSWSFANFSAFLMVLFPEVEKDPSEDKEKMCAKESAASFVASFSAKIAFEFPAMSSLDADAFLVGIGNFTSSEGKRSPTVSLNLELPPL